VLRLLTNKSAVGVDVTTQAEAWAIYDLFYENGQNVLRRRTARPGVAVPLKNDETAKLDEGVGR